MGGLWRLILFMGLLGMSKAHHFIRIVVLAGLGLAGLWMIHTLAQDFHNIQGGSGGGPKFLEKRSIDSNNNHHYRQPSREINWEFVLSRDPTRCARSFICQLAAQPANTLEEIQSNILELTRLSAERDSWASKQLQEALKYGESAQDSKKCMKMYKLCPYSSNTMTKLLKFFGG